MVPLVVYISKVYTKSGDEGQTMLASGAIVRKDAPRIRTYGDIDELNAVIGLVRIEIGREPKREGAEIFLGELDAQLARIQQELFNLGAELATPEATQRDPSATKETGGMPVVEDRHVQQLEHEIDGWNAALEPLRSFVLPGGGPIAAVCHLARTVCRRAERELVALFAEEPVRGEAIRYVNRLSDYFFVVSRSVTHRLGYPEVLWEPSNT
jgi:cob(I)alamin adenosyltransferase